MANEMRKKRIAYVESRLKEKGVKSNPYAKRGEGEKRARAQFRAEFRAKRKRELGRTTSATPSKATSKSDMRSARDSGMPKSKAGVARSARDAKPYRATAKPRSARDAAPYLAGRRGPRGGSKGMR